MYMYVRDIHITSYQYMISYIYSYFVYTCPSKHITSYQYMMLYIYIYLNLYFISIVAQGNGKDFITVGLHCRRWGISRRGGGIIGLSVCKGRCPASSSFICSLVQLYYSGGKIVAKSNYLCQVHSFIRIFSKGGLFVSCFLSISLR
jgi:hypothetical protein